MSGLDGVGWETKGPLWIWIRVGIMLGSEGHRVQICTESSVITFNWVRWLLIFFISLAISLEALEDGGYNILGVSHKPGEAEAPAAFPEWAATSQFRLLCSPLHRAGATVCMPGGLGEWSSRKWAWGTGKRDSSCFSSSVAQLELEESHLGISLMGRDSPAALSPEELETELRIWSRGLSVTEMSYLK